MSHSIIVREKTGDGVEQFDVFSRLAKDRIIMLDTKFEDHMASLVVSQLLIMSRESDEPITIYINSSGGSVSSGLAIYDTMQSIDNIIKTVVIGAACSMGAYILSSGTKGYRSATPSAEIMTHRVSAGAEGPVPDMRITMEQIQRLDDYLAERMAVHCGKKYDFMKKHLDRDYWFNAQEAVEFGLVDNILGVGKTAWGAYKGKR